MIALEPPGKFHLFTGEMMQYEMRHIVHQVAQSKTRPKRPGMGGTKCGNQSCIDRDGHRDTHDRWHDEAHWVRWVLVVNAVDDKMQTLPG